MKFEDVEEAVSFYKVYALACGFDVRRYTTKKWRDGTIKSKLLVCNREGFPYKAVVRTDDIVGSQERKRNIKRIGCKARVRLVSRKGTLESSCTCKLFERRGVPCRHILWIYLGNGLDKIPESSFAKRWTKDALRAIKSNHKGCVGVGDVDIIDKKQIEMTKLCSRGFSESNNMELNTVKDALRNRNFIVQYNPGTLESSCTCKLFERRGVPCRHILWIYLGNGLEKIPESSFAKRWTKDALRDIKSNHKGCVGVGDVDIIDKKQIEMTKLCSRGFSESNNMELNTVKDALRNRNFIVQYNPGTLESSCTCKLFERRGVPCRHILWIYLGNGLEKIPESSFAKRWTNDALRDIKSNHKGCVGVGDVDIIDKKQIEMTKLCSRGFSESNNMELNTVKDALRNRNFIVQYNPGTLESSCTCKLFERRGVPCRHIL
ncbi:hypothetical protein KSS87_011931 [Heliosperma pusillum]|nr:hypothetical protein KSS87_011931 [Heliosperma pusillum]